MPVGPYETFTECVAAQMKIYKEKHPDWTEEHLKEVAGGVCYKIEQQTREARFAYKVKAEPLILGGGKYAKVQVIDTTTSKPTGPSGVRWGVTKEALTKALRSLLQVPLLGPPETGHEGAKIVGKPVQVKVNGSADAIYEIIDDEAWVGIQSGSWGPVSPQILAKADVHEDDSVEVTDFVFEHVAFVPEGAFPSSQVEESFEGPLENFGFAYSLSAALLHDHNISDRTAQDDAAMGTRLKTPIHPQVPETKRGDRGDIMSHQKAAEFNPTAERSDRVAKQEEVESGLCEEELGSVNQKGELQMNEEEKKRIADLEEENKKLQGELATNRQKLEIHERKEPLRTFQAEIERLAAENKELKAWKMKVEDEEQTSLATDVADLRIRANLADERDRGKDIDELKKLSASALSIMKKDLELAVQMADFESGPKAKFRAGKRADNIVEQVRAELFGYTRNEKGEVA